MPNSNAYSPNPIPVAHVSDTPQLSELIERLSANTHEVWAQKRMQEGWSYGETKDAALKKTPFLVPYEELPETERETDRVIVRMALKTAIAEGWRIDPPTELTAQSSGLSEECLRAWSAHLESEFKTATNKGGKRAGSFDMDDAPEIAPELLASLPVLRQALVMIAKIVQPAWHRADAEALNLQIKHRRVAWWAIWSGTLAIALAIVQLVLGSTKPEWVERVALAEIFCVAAAGAAVVIGVWKHYHHHWLARRQCAERLSILKFQALGWTELWCDLDAWERRLAAETETLNSLPSTEARRWAMEFDSVDPDPPLPPLCRVDAKEVAALASYYRIKRLQFQKHYYETQAGKADRKAWAARWNLPLVIFFLSVMVVFVHGTMTLVGNHDSHVWHQVETWLVGLAVLLPVFGFGLRAWLAAFEVPRSRNLFHVKALALEEAIHQVRRDDILVSETMLHIARDEHFFANEHREWCRLQLEAEWFL